MLLNLSLIENFWFITIRGKGMNNPRRKVLLIIVNGLKQLYDELELLKNEEDEYLENIP